MTENPSEDAPAFANNWTARVKAAILNTIALAETTFTSARGSAANSQIARVRMQAELKERDSEIAKLREELRIKDAWISRIDPKKRHHYRPNGRMEILQLKAARGWSLVQTARAFHLDPTTIGYWMRRLDEEGSKALVQLKEPVNRYPDFVTQAVRTVKATCPSMGKVRIAKTLAREGWHMAASTVGRMLKRKPRPPGFDQSEIETQHSNSASEHGRVVTARYPNHVWHVDLTVVPTRGGFWIPWAPFSLSQVWPYCWWVAVVVDHFSRFAFDFGVFSKEPSSADVRAFLVRVIRQAGRAPRHLICDRGPQFIADGLTRWCEREVIRWRYGAVGRYGSLAVVERFIRSLKDECTRVITVPLRRKDFVEELHLYRRWYNEHRPHMYLDGRTPKEVFDDLPARNESPRREPRRKYPRKSVCAAPQARVKGRRRERLTVKITYLEGRRHLPVVELMKAA